VPACEGQHRRITLIAIVRLLGLASCGDEGPTATLTSPSENAKVPGGVALAMTADDVTIEPAGEVRGGSGHFHVIADVGSAEKGTGIAKDADHVHWSRTTWSSSVDTVAARGRQVPMRERMTTPRRGESPHPSTALT